MFLLNFILNSLFPVFCVSCGKILLKNERKDHLCQDCLSKIVIKNNPEKTDDILIYSPFDYDDISSALIKRLKYDYDRSAAIPMAHHMIAHMRASGLKDLLTESLIIPIPLHKRKLRMRGFNQAEILAKMIGHEFDLPVSNALTRTKNTNPQSSLNSNIEKALNIKDCFKIAIKTPIPQKAILIDDIWTSGATMTEAARVLHEAGCRKIYYLVFAKAK